MAPNAENQYIHTSLPSPRTIRVILLEPSPLLTSPLFCALAPRSLDDFVDDKGDYTALSYSWDAQTPSCPVICDGKKLLVTPNCAAALRRLRHATDVQILWIDGICINQTDEGLEERSGQVALMGEVYKAAKVVIVWIGESDAAMERAFTTIEGIVKPLVVEHLDRNGSGNVDLDKIREGRRKVQRELREGVQRIASQVTTASQDPIGPLFERSWFFRMWTLQEVTLAHLDRVGLRCGDLTMPWGQLVIATDALKTGKYRWGRWDEAISMIKQFTVYLMAKRYVGAKEILDDNEGRLHNSPLAFHLLVRARDKLSGDPKDKVFALYGILQELEVPFPAPDYEKSIEEVYREAVIASINYDKNLYVLYHAPSDHRRDGLASWVPDWSDRGWDEGDSRYGVLRDRFAACASADARWTFSTDQKHLVLRGKIVDTIIFRGQPLPGLDSMSLPNRVPAQEVPGSQQAALQRLVHPFSVFKDWYEISQFSDYPTGESSKDALQRTVGNDNPQVNADAQKGGAFEAWYKLLAADDLEITEIAVRRAQPGISLPALPRDREISLRAFMNRISESLRIFTALQSGGMNFHTTAMAFSQKKCFFYTDGRYFGTVADPLPTPMEPMDKIAVVAGLEMPLVVRSVEGGYRLICHAYVHGIMHGEAWPENEADLEDIVLL